MLDLKGLKSPEVSDVTNLIAFHDRNVEVLKLFSKLCDQAVVTLKKRVPAERPSSEHNQGFVKY